MESVSIHIPLHRIFTIMMMSRFSLEEMKNEKLSEFL